MANGATKQRRLDALHIVCLAFNDSIDIQKFLNYGSVTDSNVGKPLILSPDLEAKVEQEIERIRRENPNLPQLKSFN